MKTDIQPNNYIAELCDSYGFAIEDTGGGCECLRRPLTDGLSFVITDGEAGLPDLTAQLFVMTTRHSDVVAQTDMMTLCEMVDHIAGALDAESWEPKPARLHGQAFIKSEIEASKRANGANPTADDYDLILSRWSETGKITKAHATRVYNEEMAAGKPDLDVIAAMQRVLGSAVGMRVRFKRAVAREGVAVGVGTTGVIDWIDDDNASVRVDGWSEEHCILWDAVRDRQSVWDDVEQILPPVGARIKLKRDVERFPFFIAKAGAFGTVDWIEPSRQLSVKMDSKLESCEEWGNCIHWNDDDLNHVDDDIDVVSNVRHCTCCDKAMTAAEAVKSDVCNECYSHADSHTD